jgi:hypothetical protein
MYNIKAIYAKIQTFITCYDSECIWTSLDDLLNRPYNDPNEVLFVRYNYNKQNNYILRIRLRELHREYDELMFDNI